MEQLLWNLEPEVLESHRVCVCVALCNSMDSSNSLQSAYSREMRASVRTEQAQVFRAAAFAAGKARPTGAPVS